MIGYNTFRGVPMKERALLVGVETTNMTYDINYTLSELSNLANSCEIEVIEKTFQRLDRINPKTYVGSGKVNEISLLCQTLNCDLVIFDDELTPSQIRNLEAKLQKKVIDRSYLILEIFEKRAKTTEAILEIKLAKLKYMLPRLIGLNASLSRQGGGSGATSSKGSGEKQIELDKRKILSEIKQLETKLDEIKKNRSIQRNKRANTNIPIISLVGYTNAGKSTTFNNILKACHIKEEKQVLEKDMLFATLGTNVRRAILPNNQQIILIDTVGFVSKLPTLLVNSFHSTLEEITNSSLILHVIDVSNNYYQNQIRVTNEVLKQIGVIDTPQIYLLNKADKLVDKEILPVFKESMLFSNKDEVYLPKLINLLENKTMDLFNQLVDVNISINNGKLISLMESIGIIQRKIYSNEYIYYQAYIPKHLIHIFNDYLVK